MRQGRLAGWLVAAVAGMVAVSGLTLAAADDQHDYRNQARDIAREVRQSVRKSVREATRDLRGVFRGFDRDLDLGLSFDGEWLDRVIDHAVQQAQRWDAGERRRDRDGRREARERARDARDQAREARAFRQIGPGDDPCAENRNDGSRGHACEVRDTRLPAPVGPLTVDASPNGGIRVQAWDQSDVLVRAVVQTWGEDDADARAQLSRVQVTAAGTRVSAEGPDSSDGRRRSGWSVGFRIFAPRQVAFALTAHNGGISVFGMKSDVRFETRNGGVTLDELGGHVVGTTRNGGVTVRLGGSTWDGTGLDVETTNGGVSIALPAAYSAELDAGTMNGGFRTDYPLTVTGRIDRRVHATLGSGGPLLKITTTNGGVKIARR